MSALSGRGCGDPLPNYFIKRPISMNGPRHWCEISSVQRACLAFLRSSFASQLKADLGCKNMELVSAPPLPCERCWLGVALPAGLR